MASTASPYGFRAVNELGCHRFKCLNNNQMGDGEDVRGCVGEEARLDRNVWGGRLPVVWGVKLIDKKNR